MTLSGATAWSTMLRAHNYRAPPPQNLLRAEKLAGHRGPAHRPEGRWLQHVQNMPLTIKEKTFTCLNQRGESSSLNLKLYMIACCHLFAVQTTPTTLRDHEPGGMCRLVERPAQVGRPVCEQFKDLLRSEDERHRNRIQALQRTVKTPSKPCPSLPISDPSIRFPYVLPIGILSKRTYQAPLLYY